MSLHFPPLLSPPKILKVPTLISAFLSQIDRQRNLLQCERVWVRTKRQRHGDKRCWGHPYLWNMTKNKIAWSGLVWSHLMMAKKLLSTWWILFCIGPIFRYHEFFCQNFVSENTSFLLLLLTAHPFCQLWLPWAPPPPPPFFVTCYFITTKSQI